MKRVVSFLTVTIVMIGACFSVWASDDASLPADTSVQTSGSLDVTAPSYVVMEPETGNIAAQKDEKKLFPPASLAKMMTVLLTLEKVEKGDISLSDKVTASENACSAGGVEIWLKPGEQMSLEDLLISTSMGSANDAAIALAEYVAGSEDAFVTMMNDKAKKLGMENTNFLDASGIDPSSQTCAYDMALLSRELIKHEKACEYATIWMHDLRNGETELVNTNRLVRFYDGCLGLKTGISEGSGNCISAVAAKGDKKYIAVLMGVQKTDDSFEDAKSLLNYAFSHFSVYSPKIDTSMIEPVKIIGGTVQYLIPAIQGDYSVLIEAGREADVKTQIDQVKEINAPVSIGQRLGTISIKLDDKVIKEIPICTESAVPQMNYWNALLMMLQYLFC